MAISRFLGRPVDRIIGQRFAWDRPQLAGWVETGYVGVALVQQGRGTLAEPNQVAQPLAAGAVFLIPPRRRFQVAPRAGVGLVICRCQIRPRWAHDVWRRFADTLDEAPWQQGPLASLCLRPANLYDWLLAGLVEMAADPPDALGAEAFLLGLLDRWRHIGKPIAQQVDMPAWLSQALTAMVCPDHLQGGTERLAELCARTPHHVNACCQRYLGMTATAVVNRLRMEYAARHLRLSDAASDQIARSCGISNRPYFIKLFRQHYGVTPGVYRRGAI